MVLRLVLDGDESDAQVQAARRAAMRADPIVAIIDRQELGGYWVEPGPGYAPKYTGTVWSVIFLDQLQADDRDRRIRRASEYVLSHTQATDFECGDDSTTPRIHSAPVDLHTDACRRRSRGVGRRDGRGGSVRGQVSITRCGLPGSGSRRSSSRANLPEDGQSTGCSL